MAYCTIQNCLEKLSDEGATAYLDDDGDGYLKPGEEAIITSAIEYATKWIDGRLTAAGLRVKSAGVVLREMCVCIALAKACARKGNEAAWILNLARGENDHLELICKGKMRYDDEIGPIREKAARPRTSTPKIKDGKVKWKRS